VKKLILAACLLLPFTTSAVAATYISDKLEAQLRTGPSTQHKIVRILNVGMPVTVLEEDKENGYSRITTENGIEGWILTRYLTENQPARAQLENASQKLDNLALENKQLRAELDGMKRQLAEASNAKDDASVQAQRLGNELSLVRQASSNAVALLDERNQLQEKNLALENELENLRREKETLAEKDSQEWFLKGAGVLFGGILLGIIMPKLGGRKRRGWDNY
jgi:SH3 domain protein